MKILVGIPVLMNAELFKQSVESVLGREDVDLLIIDNGSESDVKAVIRLYELLPNVHVVRNEVNGFVNFSWNQIMFCFLNNNYDRLCIMNSDVVLQQDWDTVLRNYWEVFVDDLLLPVVANELSTVDTSFNSGQLVTEGTAGIFITLTKQQCEMVYPIPSMIKIWFGDNWAFSILRGVGFKTVIPPNFLATHATSSTVSRLAEAGAIIEQDKIAWDNIVSKEVQKRINQN